MISARLVCFAALLFLAGCAANNQAGTGQTTPLSSNDGAASPIVQPSVTGMPSVASRAIDHPTGTTASSSPGIAAPAGALEPLAANHAAAQLVTALTPPADLWERIRRGFAMPDLENDLVREREQWYSTRPDYILRMTERSRKYLFHIVEELELRNMPTELALLPFVESAFNPQAVSSAKAAGMWQFMPATGKYFELKQNAFRDDRRDVLASTRAALDYLQKLHGMFGDWHLALAAYNWGEGSVGRAIAKNQRANLGTGYPDLSMPAETRLYVPKLQAIKNIVAAPPDFATVLPVIENHPYFQSVTITRDIDVALAARLAQVELGDFKALNPAASRPVILAAGTSQILLPWDNAAVFEANLQAYNGTQMASWTAWRAPSTMKPAQAARQVGMGEAQLRAINNIPSGMLIRVGSTLLVPRAAAVHQDVAEQIADNGQLSLSPQALTTRKTLRAGKNDTVATVARRFKVAPGNVANWNNVSVGASFKPGQQVTVYVPARPRMTVATATTTSSKTSIKPRGKGKPIKVAQR